MRDTPHFPFCGIARRPAQEAEGGEDGLLFHWVHCRLRLLLGQLSRYVVGGPGHPFGTCIAFLL